MTGDRIEPPDDTRPRGRPTILTPELANTLCEARQNGNSITDCAAHAGIARGTLHRWLQEGEPDDAPELFRDFRDKFMRARAKAIVPLLSAAYQDAIGGVEIKRAVRPDGSEEVQTTPPNGKIALALMALLDPDEWLPRKAVEVSGPGGGPVTLNHQTDIENALAARIAAVKAKRAAQAPPAAVPQGPAEGEE